LKDATNRRAPLVSGDAGR